MPWKSMKVSMMGEFAYHAPANGRQDQRWGRLALVMSTILLLQHFHHQLISDHDIVGVMTYFRGHTPQNHPIHDANVAHVTKDQPVSKNNTLNFSSGTDQRW